MAYVPRANFLHDLFLSYAHEDAVWATALQEELTKNLNEKLGWECEIWQDKNHLRVGQKWERELETAIHASTAFLAIVSPSYHGREWCEREVTTFLDKHKAEAAEDPQFGELGRLIKVIRHPFLYGSHTDFYKHYHYLEFFKKVEGGTILELKAGTAAFSSAIKKLSEDIATLFDRMQRLLPLVFVANSAKDVAGERNFLINQLRIRGYVPWPAPRGKVWGFTDDLIRGWLDEAGCAVFVIGEEADSELRRQLDLAVERGTRLIFYLPPGYRKPSQELRNYLRAIEAKYSKLRRGWLTRLQSSSLASMREDLIQCVAPPREAHQAIDDSRMYLLCDVQTPADIDYAKKLQSDIQEQERDKIRVELPPIPGSVASPATAHETLLKICQGLLVFHDQAPNRWCIRNLADFEGAESLAGHQFKAKAVLVDVPDVRHAGLSVIHRRDPVLTQLEPFLAALRSRGRPIGNNAGGALAE